METWKKVPFRKFSSFYEVSSKGRVRRYYNDKPIIMKPYISNKYQSNKYLKIKLTDNKGISKNFFVHTLVCKAFKGNPNNKKLFCAHKNGNSLDNRASNLCWVTRIENERHKIKHKTNPVGIRNGRHRLTKKEVLDIRRLYDGKKYTTSILGRKYGVSHVQISHIINNKRWKHI